MKYSIKNIKNDIQHKNIEISTINILSSKNDENLFSLSFNKYNEKLYIETKMFIGFFKSSNFFKIEPNDLNFFDMLNNLLYNM